MSARPFLILALVFACGSPSREDETGLGQKTSDASVLFFKNIRQSSYHVREMKEAGMNIFTLKDLSESMPVSITIIQHWRDDRASVMLDFKELDSPVSIKTDDREEYLFTGENIQDHLDAAVYIFRGIRVTQPVTLRSGDKIIYLNDHRDLVEAFSITMVDYFNLTDNQKFVNSHL